MPRIANITNFDGEIVATQPWVLEQLSNIEAGSTSIFVSNSCSAENLNAYMSSLTGAVKGNIVIIKAGTAKGTYIFKDNNQNYEKFPFDDSAIISSLNTANSNIETLQSNFSKIVNEISTGVFEINPSVLPPLAITRSYTINASASAYSSLEIVDLLKQAVGGDSIQRGDLIIVTATTQARAEEVAGNYIIVQDLEDPDNLTSASYVKLYSGTGSVISVNGVGPVNGNVTLNFANLNDTSIVYNELEQGQETPTIQSISIAGTQIALKSSVDSILALIGEGFSPDYTIKQAIDAAMESSGAGDRIALLEEGLNLVERQINNNIAAINKAVELVETTFTIVDGLSGVSIELEYNQEHTEIVSQTVTVTTTGHVIQVWDAAGKVIIPDITYLANGQVTLKAKFNSTSINETWIVLRTVPIEVEIVDSSDSSNSSTSEESSD